MKHEELMSLFKAIEPHTRGALQEKGSNQVVVTASNSSKLSENGSQQHMVRNHTEIDTNLLLKAQLCVGSVRVLLGLGLSRVSVTRQCRQTSQISCTIGPISLWGVDDVDGGSSCTA